MSNKKNAIMRAVPLARVQATAKTRHDAMHTFCHERSLENAPCWWELHPHKIIMDIFNAMTPELYAELLAKIYPDNPPNASRVPPERLRRYAKRITPYLPGGEVEF